MSAIEGKPDAQRTRPERAHGATKSALPADELMGKLAKMPPEPRKSPRK